VILPWFFPFFKNPPWFRWLLCGPPP